jgi:ubiquinone/menaquinone biosynthesis C-methylase UbiE
MHLPDWQLPAGVDRGLWDYLHAAEMVAQYEQQIGLSPLAQADVAFCQKHFASPGRLLDLGCGTGRLGRYFAARGYECVGVDLSACMLDQACQLTPSELAPRLHWIQANLAEPLPLADACFDYAACLFSTLGMIRGASHRDAVVANIYRLLRPGGRCVVHAHHRFFVGLGWKRLGQQLLLTSLGHPGAGELTMPQAYAGAPLTLHHFTRSQLQRLLQRHALQILEWLPLDIYGQPARGWRIYGWLIAAQRPL